MICDGYDVPLTMMVFGEMDLTKRFKFYLTGSRYMKCARPDSDFDFIAEDSPEVRMFLASLNFGEDILPEAEYVGTKTHGNLTNAVLQCMSGGFKIQVQLTDNVIVKRQVRDVIKAYLLDEHIKANREERMYLWDTLAAALSFKHEGEPRDT